MRQSTPTKMGSKPARPVAPVVNVVPDYPSKKRDSSEKTPADIAAAEVKELLGRITKGEDVSTSDLQTSLERVLCILSPEPATESGESSLSDRAMSDDLKVIKDHEVREWLETTFTKRESVYNRPPITGNKKFKRAATLVMYGKYLNKLYQDISPQSYVPSEIGEYLKRHIDLWDFNIFKLEEMANPNQLRYVAFELFRRHELIRKFEIPYHCLDAFLVAIESGYKHHDNPYHNSTHASDVVQTLHYFLTQLDIYEWFSPLEVMASLLAAVVHDVEHTGTTNNFHVQSGSEFALLYNDRSVLENHHLYYAFKHLSKDEYNILKKLSKDDYRTLRGLVIDMVLATDMSGHFEQLKSLKSLLPHQPDSSSPLERSKVLCAMLHSADISHPSKPWDIHKVWTSRLVNEFFRQGDLEKELDRQCSPLCDRNTTVVPESQVGFIDIIVLPTFEIFADLVGSLQNALSGSDTDKVPSKNWPWSGTLQSNKLSWKEQCTNLKGNEEENGTKKKTVETVKKEIRGN